MYFPIGPGNHLIARSDNKVTLPKLEACSDNSVIAIYDP